ncbi:MAG: hypothetical protein ACRDYE_05875 [Acidimicrobiales bacterium]
MRKPFPEWIEYCPNQIWIYDTTHFSRAKSCLTVVEELVSRKRIADILSSEETSSEVEIVFTDALAADGLLELVEVRADGPVDPSVDDSSEQTSTKGRPISPFAFRVAPVTEAGGQFQARFPPERPTGSPRSPTPRPSPPGRLRIARGPGPGWRTEG